MTTSQCIKFSAQTRLQTATFRGLSLGKHQGTLTKYPLSGFVDAKKEYHSKTRGNFIKYSFLFLSSCAFCFSLWNLYKVTKNTRQRGNDASSQDALIDDTPNLTWMHVTLLVKHVSWIQYHYAICFVVSVEKVIIGYHEMISTSKDRVELHHGNNHENIWKMNDNTYDLTD